MGAFIMHIVVLKWMCECMAITGHCGFYLLTYYSRLNHKGLTCSVSCSDQMIWVTGDTRFSSSTISIYVCMYVYGHGHNTKTERERELYRECTSHSFIQRKWLEIVCGCKVILFCWFDTRVLAPGYITSSFGWDLPFPCLLHCLVFLPAPAWELFLVGSQCDNTRSFKSRSSVGMWRDSINELGNNESDVNLNICNFDRVLWHWFLMRRSLHAGVGKNTG